MLDHFQTVNAKLLCDVREARTAAARAEHAEEALAEVKEREVAARTRCTELERQLKAAADEAMQLMQSARDHDSLLTDSTSHAEELSCKVKDLEDTIGRMEREREDKSREWRATQAELDYQRSARQEVEDNLNKMRESFAHERKLMADKQLKVENDLRESRRQAERLTETLQDKEKEMQLLMRSEVEWRGEKAHLERQIEKNEEAVRTSNDQLLKVATALKQQQELYQRAQQQVAEVRAEAKSQSDDAGAEIMDLRTNLKALQSQLDDQVDRTSQLEQALTKTNDSTARVAERAQQQHEALRALLSLPQDGDEETSADLMDQALDFFQEARRVVTSALTDLEDDVDDERGLVGMFESLVQAFHAVKDQNDDLRDALERITTEQFTEQPRLRSAEKPLEELIQQAAELEEACRSAHERAAKAEERTRELEEQNREAQKKAMSAEQKAAELQFKCTQALDRASDAEQRAKELQSAGSAAEERANRAELRATELQQDYREVTKLRSKTEQEITDLKQKLKNALERASKAEQELAQVQRQRNEPLERVHAELASTQKQLVSARAESVTTREQMEALLGSTEQLIASMSPATRSEPRDNGTSLEYNRDGLVKRLNTWAKALHDRASTAESRSGDAFRYNF
jgi:chromosome segregation ATPase